MKAGTSYSLCSEQRASAAKYFLLWQLVVCHGEYRMAQGARSIISDGSSAIEHLARTCWLQCWRDGYFAMLTAAFDASGGKDQAVFITAGFISSAKDWEVFDREWRKRLADDDLPYFHMNLFAQCNGIFAKWRGKEWEHKRRSLFGDLLGIIAGSAYRKFGSSIIVKQWSESITPAVRDAFLLSSYGITGRACAFDVTKWAKSDGFGSTPIDFVFEAGDLNAGDLLNRMREDGYSAPIFRPKKDGVNKRGIPEIGFTPLQAADILAYEFGLALKRNLLDDDRSRWGFDALDKIPGEVGLFSAEDLARQARSHKCP